MGDVQSSATTQLRCHIFVWASTHKDRSFYPSVPQMAGLLCNPSIVHLTPLAGGLFLTLITSDVATKAVYQWYLRPLSTTMHCVLLLNPIHFSGGCPATLPGHSTAAFRACSNVRYILSGCTRTEVLQVAELFLQSERTFPPPSLLALIPHHQSHAAPALHLAHVTRLRPFMPVPVHACAHWSTSHHLCPHPRGLVRSTHVRSPPLAHPCPGHSSTLHLN